MKPLHAKWLSKFYNYINSSYGHKIRCNGRLSAGITDAIKMESSELPYLLDICSDIVSVFNKNPSQVEFTYPKLVNPLELCPEDTGSESYSDWEEEDTHDGNVFGVFKD